MTPRPIITEEALTAAQQAFFASVQALRVRNDITEEPFTCADCGRRKRGVCDGDN